MKVTAKLSNLRIAPRKVRLLTDAIKGRDTQDAVFQLRNTIVKRAALPIAKLIESAQANAEHNFGLDKNNLYVYSIVINEGPTLKRWMPRAHGRATQIHKKTSHVHLVLEEIEEGKNRKTPEQIENERKEREQARLEALKAQNSEGKDAEADEKTDAKDEQKGMKGEQKQQKQAGSGSGWKQKVFRRKAG